MKALVFDIDGTLTQTNRVDGHFFRAAVHAVIPSCELDSFSSFDEMTDSAILRQICADEGLAEYEAIERSVQQHFLDGLHGALRTQRGAFSAVPGAGAVLSVARDAGWVPAVATGGWRPSAQLKLRAAGIPMAGVCLATSSEADRRVDIIRRAVQGAAEGQEVSEVVYVGDGSWDVRACRELGIGFIGRGNAERAAHLLGLGAKIVLPDFEEPDSLLAALARSPELVLSSA